MICKSQTHATAAVLGNPPAPDVSARRPPRCRGLPVRRLARGRRAVLVAGSPARAARRGRLAVPLGLGVRRVTAAPPGAGGCCLEAGARGLRRAPLLLDR